MIFAALAWPAFAMEEPCRNVQMDLAFTACWREEFKIRGGVCTKAARAAERHHKDEPNLQSTDDQGAASVACLARGMSRRYLRVDRRIRFSVYWNRCRIKMSQARTTKLQDMINKP